MSITINPSSPSTAQSSSASEGAQLLTAALAKNNQELEGQMALQLIQSANTSSLPAPTGVSGNNVNIKV